MGILGRKLGFKNCFVVDLVSRSGRLSNVMEGKGEFISFQLLS